MIESFCGHFPDLGLLSLLLRPPRRASLSFYQSRRGMQRQAALYINSSQVDFDAHLLNVHGIENNLYTLEELKTFI